MDIDDRSFERHHFESLHRPLFAADIVTERISPPPFLIEPIFRSHTLTMLSAEPFTGKTLFCLAMILSLDTGKPLLNTLKPASGHRCLFIGQDSPTWDIHGQFLKLYRGMGLPEGPGAPPLPSLFLLNRGLSLLDSNFITLISQITSLYNITVLFFDTLLDFHGLEENSNSAMSRVMRVLKSIRDNLGLTIFFTHHTSKPAREANGVPQISRTALARGASVIGGAIDLHAALDRAGGSPKNPIVRFTLPKGRGIDAPEPITFTIAPHLDGLRLTPTGDSCHTRILDLLDTPRTVASLRETLGLSRSTLYYNLNTLREEGKIEKVNNEWRLID